MVENEESYQPDPPIKTSFSPEELIQIDKKMQLEDIARQEALKNMPSSNKKIIGMGKKSPDRPFFRLKPARPFWDKKSRQPGK